MRKKYRSRGRIDFQRIYESARCDELAAEFLHRSPPMKKYDCPICGKVNAISATSKTWSCWKSGCHETGLGKDAVGLLSIAKGISRIESGRLLEKMLGITKGLENYSFHASNEIAGLPKSLEPRKNSNWADNLRELCDRAHENLLIRGNETSKAAWTYLTEVRKLRPQTIEKYRLGIQEVWQEFHAPLAESDKSCKLAPGIVFPWIGPTEICAVNVRQLHIKLPAKYCMARGSRREWAYPYEKNRWAHWTGPILIVEGEADSLVGIQELGEKVPVRTIGGASSKPWDVKDAIFYSKASKIMVCADKDDSGDKSWQLWRNFSPRSIRVSPPCGKDLSESFQRGADLGEWFDQLSDSLNVRWDPST